MSEFVSSKRYKMLLYQAMTSNLIFDAALASKLKIDNKKDVATQPPHGDCILLITNSPDVFKRYSRLDNFWKQYGLFYVNQKISTVDTLIFQNQYNGTTLGAMLGLKNYREWDYLRYQQIMFGNTNDLIQSWDLMRDLLSQYPELMHHQFGKKGNQPFVGVGEGMHIEQIVYGFIRKYYHQDFAEDIVKLIAEKFIF